MCVSASKSLRTLFFHQNPSDLLVLLPLPYCTSLSLLTPIITVALTTCAVANCQSPLDPFEIPITEGHVLH